MCSRRFSGLVCWLPTLRPVGLPELQSLPDVSPPVGHGLERGRVSGRGRPLGNGPILGVAVDLRGVTRQTDRAQDRILHRAGVLSGLSYRQEVANASCPRMRARRSPSTGSQR